MALTQPVGRLAHEQARQEQQVQQVQQVQQARRVPAVVAPALRQLLAVVVLEQGERRVAPGERGEAEIRPRASLLQLV